MQPRQSAPTAGAPSLERIGLWLGIIAPVLIIGGFAAVDEGGTELTGSLSDIVAHLASLHGRMVVGSLIGILGGLALLGFVVSLKLHLGRRGESGEWLSSLALAFGVIITIGAIVQGSFRLAIASIVSSDLPPADMLPLWRLDGAWAILAWGAVGLVATMCLGAFTDGLVPKSLAGIGLLLAAGTAALTPTDHGGVSLALLLWLVAAAGALILRSRESVEPAD